MEPLTHRVIRRAYQIVDSVAGKGNVMAHLLTLRANMTYDICSREDAMNYNGAVHAVDDIIGIVARTTGDFWQLLAVTTIRSTYPAVLAKRPAEKPTAQVEDIAKALFDAGSRTAATGVVGVWDVASTHLRNECRSQAKALLDQFDIRVRG